MTKWIEKCDVCGRLVRINKPIIGSLHICENTNSELTKLKKEIIDLGTSVVSKDKRLETLMADRNKEFSHRIEIETKYNQLKKEAIDFYKNELLMSSMKIIFKLLKEEKPENALLQQQALAQQGLDRIRRESFNQQTSGRGLLGGIFG